MCLIGSIGLCLSIFYGEAASILAVRGMRLRFLNGMARAFDETYRLGEVEVLLRLRIVMVSAPTLQHCAHQWLSDYISPSPSSAPSSPTPSLSSKTMNPSSSPVILCQAALTCFNTSSSKINPGSTSGNFRTCGLVNWGQLILVL